MALSVLLGGLIGSERRASDRPAGIRTMALVSLGSCFFTISSMLAFRASPMSWDSSRVSAAIPSGVGFFYSLHRRTQTIRYASSSSVIATSSSKAPYFATISSPTHRANASISCKVNNLIGTISFTSVCPSSFICINSGSSFGISSGLFTFRVIATVNCLTCAMGSNSSSSSPHTMFNSPYSSSSSSTRGTVQPLRVHSPIEKVSRGCGSSTTTVEPGFNADRRDEKHLITSSFVSKCDIEPNRIHAVSNLVENRPVKSLMSPQAYSKLSLRPPAEPNSWSAFSIP
ncbi:hypothetical protein ACHAWT_007654 [Skeletonema menzelii]